MTTCPIHGEECGRIPRFAELDELCARGWGHVPGTQIERIMRRNGGRLPEEQPEPEPGEKQPMTCWCGAVFVPARYNQTHCTPVCTKAHKDARAYARKKEREG